MSTEVKSTMILNFSFFGANVINIITYMVSIPAPTTLIVDTNILFGDTNGNPYLNIMQTQKKHMELNILKVVERTQLASLFSM